MASFYNLTSKQILLDNLICQYDMEEKIPKSENQCSWYVYSVIKNLKNNNWNIPNNLNELKKLHEESLILASNLRNQNAKVSWGESIFSKTIQDIFKLPVNSPKIVKIGDCDNNNYLNIKTMNDIINYKLSLPKYSFSELIKKIQETKINNSYFLINRHGQSFLIYPFKNEFIIFDSHVREIGIFDINGISRYILNKSDSNLITFIEGYMIDNIFNNNNYDDTNLSFKN